MTSLPEPRILRAPNPGPFTLDGTRTYLVGRKRIVVIDPGPDDPGHLRRIVDAAGDGSVAAILLTHRHGDHAAGARALARETGAPVRAGSLGAATAAAEVESPAGALSREEGTSLADGDGIPTDAGELLTVATPGHAPDHLAFHWPRGRAAFVGDLLLGEGDTTYVGSPGGDVAAYLRSLERVEALETRRLYPGHGPPVEDPEATIRRFRRHRESRVEEVARLLHRDPDAGPEEITRAIYGDEVEEPVLLEAARRSVEAIIGHLREGRVDRGG